MCGGRKCERATRLPLSARFVLRLDTVLLKVWTIELHASRFGKRLNEARWGAYPNEILLWRVPLESAEVRLRLGRVDESEVTRLAGTVRGFAFG